MIFVRSAQIYKTYVERMLIKTSFSGGKSATKMGTREFPKVLYMKTEGKRQAPG